MVPGQVHASPSPGAPPRQWRSPEQALNDRESPSARVSVGSINSLTFAFPSLLILLDGPQGEVCVPGFF